MKKLLSLILASLLLSSSVVSCGQKLPSETESRETTFPETTAAETISETVPSETTAPTLSYNADTVTENGIAKAHIVLSDTAVQLERYAAEELVYHIKLVSGADIAVTNEIGADSLPIIIGTPDSLPELEELFPEDLSWLRDMGDGAKVRWSDDGFSIRQKDGKLYIFGATAKGALNGVYDFIEDNMGVLWIRATNMSEYPIIYDEMATIAVTKANYREKSPFAVRGWTLSGNSIQTQTMYSRNKMNTRVGNSMNDIGMQGFLSGHSIKDWISSSPSYDPTCTEYWNTDMNGNHYTHEEAFAAATLQTVQVNFWSDVTVQCIADSILAYLDANYETRQEKYIGVSLMDSKNISVYPEMTEPYEYAPGQFVYPTSAGRYISTVYFSFLNKIARIVGEKYPDVIIHAYAYFSTVAVPECDLDPNVYATFCPIDEDLSSTIDNPDKPLSYAVYQHLMNWIEKTPNVQVYNYYGCQVAAPFYGRAIWDRMQSDILLYAENGFNGVVSEGFADVDVGWCTSPSYGIVNEDREPYLNMKYGWAMNAMTYWLYSKLAWNPYEDVDALIEYYCDKVYGDGAEYMKEYIRLLEISWADGGESIAMEFNNYFLWSTGLDTIYDYFLNIEVDGVHILTAIQENLHKAYDAADERGKAHIQYIMENYDRIEYLTWGN